MKMCIKCGIKKEIDSFYKGINQCKECKRIYEKERSMIKMNNDVIKGVKKCNKCNEEKEVNLFYKNSNLCKKCGKVIYRETKEKYEERRRNYRVLHKDERKEYWDNYYSDEENKNKVLEKGKRNYLKDKDTENYNERRKKYYEENKEKILLRCKEYERKNRDKRRNRQKIRLLTDPLFKLTRSLRGLARIAFKGKGYIKNTKTEKLLGCSFNEFKSYLESKFESWMTYENYGKYNGELNYGWDIDHITPLDSANTENEISELCHYTNLQPLCSKINREIKRNIIKWKMEEN